MNAISHVVFIGGVSCISTCLSLMICEIMAKMIRVSRSYQGSQLVLFVSNSLYGVPYLLSTYLLRNIRHFHDSILVTIILAFSLRGEKP